MNKLKLSLLTALALGTFTAIAIAADKNDWGTPQPGDPPFFIEGEDGEPVFPDMNETPLTVCRTVAVDKGYNIRLHLSRLCWGTECCTTSCRTGPNGQRVCSTSCTITETTGTCFYVGPVQ